MKHRSTPNGVALVEALIALLIVAFGMISLAGLQGQLRRSADLAKQRSEALRLAQQDVETLRAYSALSKEAGSPPLTQDFAGIASRQVLVRAGASGSNTDFAVLRTVTPFASGSPLKAIHIEVHWVDSTGADQTVKLDTLIAGLDPSLGASLGIAPDATPLRRPAGRHAGIPPTAKDLGDGSSAYKPQVDGTLAWLLDNRSGEISAVCAVPMSRQTASLTRTELANCQSNGKGYLLSGVVRFSWAAPPLSGAPAGPARPVGVTMHLSSKGHPLTPSFACYTEPPAGLSQVLVNYSCIVYPNTETPPIWSGTVDLNGLPFSGNDAVKVCRYSADHDGDGLLGNAEHPLAYSRVGGSLRNQNFLVIDAGQDCPAGRTVDPARGVFSNTATVLHQDANTPSHGS
jgi:hypothetical protein